MGEIGKRTDKRRAARQDRNVGGEVHGNIASAGTDQIV
jgi:hypothetical protein